MTAMAATAGHLVVTAAAVAGGALVFDRASLFSWHPVLVFIWLALSGNAVLFMRARRCRLQVALWLHMLLQLGAWFALAASLYVMFLVKEANQKAHWWNMSASWHAWGGAFTAFLFTSAIGGALFTMPPGSSAKAISSQGAHHKAWTRIFTIGLCITLLSGWYKLKSQEPLPLYSLVAALCIFLWLAGMFTIPPLEALRGPRESKKAPGWTSSKNL